MAVRIGKPAPEFEGEAWTRGAHGPKKVGLSQHRGKWVILFFYPRDFTFICPTEIASFGAMQKDFERENAVVIGVSTDSFYTHKAWFESDPRLANINYPVIADTGHQVSGAFDVLLHPENRSWRILPEVLIVDGDIAELHEVELELALAKLGQGLGELAIDGFAPQTPDQYRNCVHASAPGI